MKNLLLDVTLLVLLAVCASSDAAAQRRFDTVDKLLLGASTLAMAGDWSTTIDAANRGGREVNPITSRIIGHYPSRSQVNIYMGASIAWNALVAWRLPPKWRKIWLAAVTLNGARATLGNLRRGLRFSVQF